MQNPKFKIQCGHRTYILNVPLLLVGCLCLPIVQNILTKLLSRISISALCVYPPLPVSNISSGQSVRPDAPWCSRLHRSSPYWDYIAGSVYLLYFGTRCDIPTYVCTLYNKHNSSVSLYFGTVYKLYSPDDPINDDVVCSQSTKKKVINDAMLRCGS